MLSRALTVGIFLSRTHGGLQGEVDCCRLTAATEDGEWGVTRW